MLARLRREFVAIMMLVSGLVLAGVLGTALFTTHMTQRAITESLLERALEGDVSTPLIGDSTGEQSADVVLAAIVDDPLPRFLTSSLRHSRAPPTPARATATPSHGCERRPRAAGAWRLSTRTHETSPFAHRHSTLPSSSSSR